jgi:hypothetical protein
MPTVTVACKIPCGLILQVYASEDWQEAVMGGGHRTAKRAFVNPKFKPVKINGPARAIGKDLPHEIRNGVGLTHGVDADLFAAWLEQNKDSDFVVKGMVFANVKPSEVDAVAKDHITLKSGLERIDPNNLPDEFRRGSNKITTADVT